MNPNTSQSSWNAANSDLTKVASSSGLFNVTPFSTVVNNNTTTSTTTGNTSLITLPVPTSSTATNTGTSNVTPTLITTSTATNSTTSSSAITQNVTSTTWTTVTSSQAGTTTAAPMSITFSQLEDNVNKWVHELDELEKMYLNQSLQINSWDRILIENGEKILSLKGHFEHLKTQQEELEQELDFVVSQQKELDDVIRPLEKELSNLPVVDNDRKNTYELAENIDRQIKQMTEELKDIVENLNDVNRSQNTNNPLLKIGRILNMHMNSLQWIDRSIVQMESNLDQVTKMTDEVRLDKKFFV